MRLRRPRGWSTVLVLYGRVMKRPCVRLNAKYTPTNAGMARQSGAQGLIATGRPVDGLRRQRRLLAVVTAAAAIAALTLTALVAVSGAPLPGDVR